MRKLLQQMFGCSKFLFSHFFLFSFVTVKDEEELLCLLSKKRKTFLEAFVNCHTSTPDSSPELFLYFDLSYVHTGNSLLLVHHFEGDCQLPLDFPGSSCLGNPLTYHTTLSYVNQWYPSLSLVVTSIVHLEADNRLAYTPLVFFLCFSCVFATSLTFCLLLFTVWMQLKCVVVSGSIEVFNFEKIYIFSTAVSPAGHQIKHYFHQMRKSEKLVNVIFLS